MPVIVPDSVVLPPENVRFPLTELPADRVVKVRLSVDEVIGKMIGWNTLLVSS